ncbi:MAG: FAD-dependent oxidoreductase [Cyanobacteria bacterium P01_G01_bin.38]
MTPFQGLGRSAFTQSLEATHATAPHICIVGGGFGGLYTALYLERHRILKAARVTLVEPRGQFLFTPLTYELLTHELETWEVAPTYSSLIHSTSIDWQQDQATQIDLAQRQVTLGSGEVLTYDYLVIATGARSRPVDIPGVEEHTLGFRSLSEVLTLKARLAQVLVAYPKVAVTVVGGGPSGVELAAKVADRLGRRGQITLVDSGDRILKPFAVGLQKVAIKALQRRGVQLVLGAQVTQVEAERVLGQQGSEPFELASHLTIWAVGTEPMPWLGQQPLARNQQGQCLTLPTLQLMDYPEVFMLGDGAAITPAQKKQSKSAAPNTAQAAYQAAATVAHNVSALVQQRQPKPFRYVHLGDMLTLGYGVAGVWSFGIALGGQLGGLIRRAVYIHRLPTREHRWRVLRRAWQQLIKGSVRLVKRGLGIGY